MIQNEYVRRAFAKRKAAILAYLGGQCVSCGATENLECDHIDAATKSFNIVQNWCLAWERLVVELAKCQLLCKCCHVEKTNACGEHRGPDIYVRVNAAQHGTAYMYKKYGCRCEPCKAAKAAQRRLSK
jgi:hypothetical protein